MLRFKVLSLLIGFLLLTTVVITGCEEGGANTEAVKVDEELLVVASISIIADIAQNVLGDRGVVEFLVPLGDNPEDYELIPSDFKKVTDAGLILLNGWGLEEGIERSVDSIADINILYVTDGITPIPLVGESGNDPHAWLDPNEVITYVENIMAAFAEVDPQGEAEYRQNADSYIKQLKELDSWISEKVMDVPEDNRVLVISENALKYFGDTYDFQTEGIWELNAHEEGTPQQISRVVDLVKERNLPAIFVESTLDSRFMERISKETGVPIAGEIYTDGLGAKGSGAETYIQMMEHNVNIFVEGLKE